MSAMVKKVCFCRSGTYLYRKRMGEQAFYRWGQMSPIGDMSPAWGHVHREALASYCTGSCLLETSRGLVPICAYRGSNKGSEFLNIIP